MFRRKTWAAVMVVAGVAAVAIPATASAATPLGPCTVGNPSSCTFHPRPNITVFCGREHSVSEYHYHDFRGCDAHVGGADVKCGNQADFPNTVGGSYYTLTGCIVKFGVSRIVVGCEASGFDGGFYGIDDQTCGASPVIACESSKAYRDDSYDSSMTCGREPVVLRCVDNVNNFVDPPIEYHYCDLVIGPAAAPIFSCRFDSADPTTTVADVTGCLTGLGARRRFG